MGSQEPKWLQTAWYYVPSALVMLGLLLFWQFAVDFWQIKEYIVPSPWAAIKTLSQPNYQWTVNFLTTLYAVLGAFALSAGDCPAGLPAGCVWQPSPPPT